MPLSAASQGLWNGASASRLPGNLGHGVTRWTIGFGCVSFPVAVSFYVAERGGVPELYERLAEWDT